MVLSEIEDSMRVVVILLVAILFAGTIDAQPKRGGKVKRKYRQVETYNEDLPQVYVHGRVLNQARMPLQGATVTVPGMRIGVHTNSEGRYFLQGLPTGKVSIMVSYTGYKTKIIDYYLQEGNNDVYFTLDQDRVALEPAPVTVQVLDQHLLDIPASASTFSETFAERNNFRQITDYIQLVPGILVFEAEPVRASYSIRGVSGDVFNPENSPAIAFRMNGVPINRGVLVPSRLFDMERIEVMNGSAGTLYGADAFMGVVNLVSRKPVPGLSGYASAASGNFGWKEAEGALNIPIYKNFVMARTSGVYYQKDGYVENDNGKSLNGANMFAGRAILRIVPFYRTRIDLEFNYQNDSHSGIAWISKGIPGTNVGNEIFNTPVSVDWGGQPGTQREAMGGSLQLRHYKNENNYLSAKSSWSSGKLKSLRDGDGLPVSIIHVAEDQHVTQLMQEISYHFSRRSRTNGTAGIRYLNEDHQHKVGKKFNEQFLGQMFLGQPIVNLEGSYSPLPAFPVDSTLGVLSGLSLPTEHAESFEYISSSQHLELYADASFRIRPRLLLNAGIRGTAGILSVSGDADVSGGEPSVLGKMGPAAPGLEYKPGPRAEVTRRFILPSWRAGLKHDFNSISNVYLNYSFNSRIPVVSFIPSGIFLEPLPQKLQSLEAGFKVSALHRFWVDAVFFYQIYSHFQTSVMDSTINAYTYKDSGKATGYGTELQVRAAILKGLDFHGSYSYLNATIDKIDRDGNAQELQGNRFGFAPEHTFNTGLSGRVNLAHDLLVFVNPHYSWNSGFWYDNMNTTGMYQDSYGIANIVAGVELTKPSVIVSMSASNILNEKYVKSLDRSNEPFGFITYIPGSPRIFGVKINWKY